MEWKPSRVETTKQDNQEHRQKKKENEFRVTPRLFPQSRLRANVTNGQTFGGNSSKINSAHILMLGRP